MTPVMITGDHKATATAIARELGILDDSAAACGVELDSLMSKSLSAMSRGIGFTPGYPRTISSES